MFAIEDSRRTLFTRRARDRRVSENVVLDRVLQLGDASERAAVDVLHLERGEERLKVELGRGSRSKVAQSSC